MHRASKARVTIDSSNRATALHSAAMHRPTIAQLQPLDHRARLSVHSFDSLKLLSNLKRQFKFEKKKKKKEKRLFKKYKNLDTRGIEPRTSPMQTEHHTN
jgi:hypothetical protein